MFYCQLLRNGLAQRKYCTTRNIMNTKLNEVPQSPRLLDENNKFDDAIVAFNSKNEFLANVPQSRAF